MITIGNNTVLNAGNLLGGSSDALTPHTQTITMWEIQLAWL